MVDVKQSSGWSQILLFLAFLALFIGSYFLFVMLGGVLGVFSPLPVPDTQSVGALFSLDEAPLFLLDAGHGGMDSGAVAQDGTLEKNLNLALVEKIKVHLESAGARVILTRSDDTLLESPNAPSSKSGDLMARVQCAKKYPDGIFVSIHMNKFPQSRYHGLQVFYSPNAPKSADLALAVQENVSRYLQPENSRAAKKAGSEIYILDRITLPAILVECGFLSNSRELELLKNEVYQSLLAFVIAHSLLEGALDQ